MPEAEYVWLPRKDLLTFEEIRRLVDVFARLGVDKLRLTGGEPLLRKDLPLLVRLLAKNTRIKDLAMTTNGVQLAEQARPLFDAGLGRVTVSLDTLRTDRFQAMNNRDHLPNVLAGIEAARDVGFNTLKIDSVVIRGTNEDELADLIEFGKRVGAEVRFIEYMDVGGATKWSMDQVVPRFEILQALEKRYGATEPIVEASSAPAERHALPDGTIFGIIASTTRPFCQSCDRSRLTADGQWYLCLYARQGIDLRGPLRKGASQQEIQKIIESEWARRDDRGAEDRLGIAPRDVLVKPEGLRKNPHLEMHTRGG
jgi:cyclic pyranopterin phosphate synthase